MWLVRVKKLITHFQGEPSWARTIACSCGHVRPMTCQKLAFCNWNPNDTRKGRDVECLRSPLYKTPLVQVSERLVVTALPFQASKLRGETQEARCILLFPKPTGLFAGNEYVREALERQWATWWVWRHIKFGSFVYPPLHSKTLWSLLQNQQMSFRASIFAIVVEQQKVEC